MVKWDNPESSAKGSFVPIGKAYPSNAKICRSFRAEVALKAPKTMEGVACADKDGNWAIANMVFAKLDDGAKSPSPR